MQFCCCNVLMEIHLINYCDMSSLIKMCLTIAYKPISFMYQAVCTPFPLSHPSFNLLFSSSSCVIYSFSLVPPAPSPPSSLLTTSCDSGKYNGTAVKLGPFVPWLSQSYLLFFFSHCKSFSSLWLSSMNINFFSFSLYFVTILFSSQSV